MRLAKELGLSEDQREKMREIWEGLMQEGPREFERRWEIESQYRSEAEALLTPEQREKYDEIMSRHRGPGGMPGGLPLPHGGGVPGLGPQWSGPGVSGHHGGEWEGPGVPTTGRTDRP